MNPSQPTPTPDWKEIILASPEWPGGLTIPQSDQLPEGSESIQDSMFMSEHWEWELWRHPGGHCYYLKVRPINEGRFGEPNTPGVALTVMETFQFLLSNLMPRHVLADLLFEQPGILKPFDPGPHSPGLN